MQPIATDVRGVVIPGAGHWVAEQAPEELLAALTTFLAPYRSLQAVPMAEELAAAAIPAR
jgi:hypothetical protein